MKKIRRFALLAIFGLNMTTMTMAYAGPPAGNDPKPNAPAYDAPRLFTTSQLETLLKAGYDKVEKDGEGEFVNFYLNKIRFTPKPGDTPIEWSVSMNLRQRDVRQSYVRLYFPCQKVTADVNSVRLQELMELGGVMKDSPAYFVIAGTGKDRMLYLATDVSTENLTTAKLKEDINRLFLAAHGSMAVWDAPLNTPRKKPETKAEVKKFDGKWMVYKKMEDGTPAPIVNGTTCLTFAADGTCKIGVTRNAMVIKKYFEHPGTYTIDGDKITLCCDDLKVKETHKFELKDGILTITPEKDDGNNIIPYAKTFYLWK